MFELIRRRIIRDYLQELGEHYEISLRSKRDLMIERVLKEGEKKMKEVIIDGVKYAPVQEKEPPAMAQLIQASSFICNDTVGIFKLGDFKMHYRSGMCFLLTADKYKELFE